MLEFIEGDLFDSPAQTLTNAVNTAGVMGKGIAKQFKLRYPEMFEEYRRLCRKGALGVGDLHLFEGADKRILNFPTKQHWRSASKLEWIDAGLRKLAASWSRLGIESLAMPRLGCGLGHLQWSEVRPLVEQHLGSLPLPVFVYALD